MADKRPHPDVFIDGRTIYVSGEIGGYMQPFREALRTLALADATVPIILVLTSPGGSCLGGFALMDEIELLRRETGVEVHGVVQGWAMSMGLTILQACDRRYAGPYSVLMAHGSVTIMGGDAKDRKAQEKLTDILHRKMATLYAAKTAPVGGKSEEEWLHLFEEDTPLYLSAEEALSEGLIDAIIG